MLRSPWDGLTLWKSDHSVQKKSVWKLSSCAQITWKTLKSFKNTTIHMWFERRREAKRRHQLWGNCMFEEQNTRRCENMDGIGWTQRKIVKCRQVWSGQGGWCVCGDTLGVGTGPNADHCTRQLTSQLDCKAAIAACGGVRNFCRAHASYLQYIEVLTSTSWCFKKEYLFRFAVGFWVLCHYITLHLKNRTPKIW